MKITINKYHFLFALILPFLFNACSNDDAGENFDAFVDVFTVKKKVNGVAKKANAYYVYGNNTVASASAMPPDNSINRVSLTAIDDQKYDYHHQPDTSEFNLIPPPSGTYVFEIESAEREKIQKADLLQVIDLTIPEIITTSFNTSTLTLAVRWNKLTDSDGFFIKLLNNEGNIIYISNALAGSATEFYIGTGGGTWISSASVGEELMLQIQSVVIENDADEDYSLYNIEGTAIAEKKVTWGQ